MATETKKDAKKTYPNSVTINFEIPFHTEESTVIEDLIEIINEIDGKFYSRASARYFFEGTPGEIG